MELGACIHVRLLEGYGWDPAHDPPADDSNQRVRMIVGEGACVTTLIGSSEEHKGACLYGGKIPTHFQFEWTPTTPWGVAPIYMCVYIYDHVCMS